MLEEQGGWYVLNVKDALWMAGEDFAKVANFERGVPFTDVGINLRVLEPGEPNCRYHRENAQENFLVISGRCKLIANEEEQELGPWDFVHCPPGVSHVLVGAGEGPCVMLAIGHRKGEAHEYFYPASEKARKHNAVSPEPTDQIPVAYSDLKPREVLENVEWPLD